MTHRFLFEICLPYFIESCTLNAEHLLNGKLQNTAESCQLRLYKLVNFFFFFFWLTSFPFSSVLKLL